ncbi:MAG: hypothetical protein LRZ85_06755 [Alphaproteobacteria bacterium]|nr:hypothetical protein [Alphaproteobacteria bacterium]MCD8526426.1 hypothetical protein [Alphaproteobacteria bacterium]MCD8571375.1 hypothetical protein [Alphaproteobacteria bacterium]
MNNSNEKPGLSDALKAVAVLAACGAVSAIALSAIFGGAKDLAEQSQLPGLGISIHDVFSNPGLAR